MRFLKLPPRDWLFVLGIIVTVYILQNFVLTLISEGFAATYLWRPILWVLLAVLIFRLPRQRAIGRRSLRPVLVKIGLGVGAVQVYFTVLAGFLEGFGESPNSFTPLGILINVVFMSTNIIGVELCRAWLLNSWARKPTSSLPIFTAMLFTFFNLSWSLIPKLDSNLETYTKFLGSDFLPLYLENYMASFLALWGGAWPAVAYRAVLQGFTWFSPVLPNMSWALKALTGTVVPILGIAVIKEAFLSSAHPAKSLAESEQGLISWALLSVFVVVAIWFGLGVFPLKPTSIVSGSMRPTFDVGDIVIVAKKRPELLKVGDIIQFRGEDSAIPTVHRIISSKKDQGRNFFVTKGDANNSPDRKPVPWEKVTGTVIFTIPKAGWVTITVRQVFS